MLDDLRDALKPEKSPIYWQWRLDRFIRRLWRIAITILVILVLGGLVELLGA